MYLAVKDLERGKVRFQETYQPGSISLLEEALRQTTPLVARGSADLTVSTGEIRVQGHFEVGLEMDCDRCLETIRLPLESDFDLTYEPSSWLPAGEVEIKERDAEIGYYEGDGLDLGEVLREQILLALPMQRVCSDACKGICPVCGQNRNLTACGCEVHPTDDRWAGLKDLGQ